MRGISQKELRRIAGIKEPKKYRSTPVTCKLGHRHRSTGEAMHCWRLQMDLRDGQIVELQYERKFELKVNGVLVGSHYPDFTFKRPVFVTLPHPGSHNSSYIERTADFKLCVDEFKGFRTKDWIFKQKIFVALYPEIEYRVIQ